MTDSGRRKATALAVVAGFLVTLFGLPFGGPLAIVLGAGVFYWTLRPLMSRFGTPTQEDYHKATHAAIWAIVPLCAVIGGFLVLLMAGNPDGYMQPKPKGSEVWSLALFGALIGAVGGAVLAVLFRAFHSIFMGKPQPKS